MPSTRSSAPSERPTRRHGWLVVLAGVVVVAGVASVVAALTSSGDDSPDTPREVSSGGRAEIGDAAPDFELPALGSDSTVRLSDYRGRPVVLNFWASYCKPCRDEFPLFKRALRAHADEDLAIIGVAFEDIPSDSRAFVRKQGARWPMAVDDRGAIGKQEYGIRALPQTFFIRRDGTIADHFFAGLTTEADLEEPLDKILR